MVLKRKFSWKTRPRRRSKRAKIRRRLSARRRGIMRSNCHMFKRYGATPSTYSFNSTTTGDAMTFSLDQVASASELTALYDQYKINKVVVKFQLINVPDSGLVYAPGANTGTYQSTNFYPRIWYYRDYDDSSAVDLAAMRQIGKARFKVLRPNKTISIALRPAMLNQLYRTAASTGYAPIWKQRIDCSQGNVPHYSLKFLFDLMGVGSTTNFQVRAETVYYFTMYNSR